MRFFRRRKQTPTNAEYRKMDVLTPYPLQAQIDSLADIMRDHERYIHALEHRIKVVETHRPAVDALIKSNHELTKKLHWLEKRVDEHYAVMQHISNNGEKRYRELEQQLAFKVNREEERE